ncbi:DUF1653 domain-containing protein [Oribacterium sp. P6A1]|uniref:DUF1653 domain-containing protein n=1 Tax=Oribacterium sp. P6A1 TaxID=1410612 RepID=UPI00068BA33E|nr:DUF1653 domain-containing protein [Oribacterium sp. P6A1]
MNTENRVFKSGDIVKHFKRETVDQNTSEYIYKIVGIAAHTETGEKMMVYQALYGDCKLYVRPYEMFLEEVDRNKYPKIKQKYRFEKMTITKSEMDYIKAKYNIIL